MIMRAAATKAEAKPARKGRVKLTPGTEVGCNVSRLADC
jgi:hypothetical protein